MMGARRRKSNAGPAVRRLCGLLVLGHGLLGLSQGARGQGPSQALTIDQLSRMGPAEIETIYRHGTVAALPPGRLRGTALLAPGTRRGRLLSRGARAVWQGKVISTNGAEAVNRFFGVRAIRGRLYQGASWLDGAPALVLDYSQTSRIYADNRDEIRQVAPGLFLGLMYNRATMPPRLSMYFALEARP